MFSAPIDVLIAMSSVLYGHIFIIDIVRIKFIVDTYRQICAENTVTQPLYCSFYVFGEMKSDLKLQG